MCEEKRSAGGALRIYKSRKEPLPSGGGIFSALSCPHPCYSRDKCGIMWAMNGRLFQGGYYVFRNKQSNGLPRSTIY